jgi:hypothetical protein
MTPHSSIFPPQSELSTWDSGVNNFPPPFGTFGPFDEHLCPSGGKTRTAKNIDGSDLHLLSAGSNRAYHLLIPLHEERHRRKDPAFSCSREGLYEGYFDDAFGECFCPFLIDRIAFGSPHSGLHEFDVGQRPAKSLGSWTPFRLQKIGYTEVLHTHSSRSFSWDPPLLFFHTPSILPFFSFILDSFLSILDSFLLSSLPISTSPLAFRKDCQDCRGDFACLRDQPKFVFCPSQVAQTESERFYRRVPRHKQ